MELVIPALQAAPGGEVDHAHGPQPFDQRRPAAVRGAELAVAGQQQLQVAIAGRVVVGQKQPEVLDAGAVQHVVEIDHHQAFAGALQDVAGMKIAVQPDGFKALEAGRQVVDDARTDLAVFLAVRFGDRLRHELGRIPAGGGFRCQLEPRGGPPFLAGIVQPAQQGAHPHPALLAFDVEGAPAPLGKDGKEYPAQTPQRLTVFEHQGADHGDVDFGAVPDKVVLVLQGGPGPAPGAVEFGDVGGFVRRLDLVDAIDVTVEGTGEGGQAGPQRLFQGRQKAVGGQLGKMVHASLGLFSAEGFRRRA